MAFSSEVDICEYKKKEVFSPIIGCFFSFQKLISKVSVV
jgi:hypothetical protein